jgi:putative endonuclease
LAGIKTAEQKNGDYGETQAAAHLALHGYHCVARNYHSRYGEIDLIAQGDRYLLFVEVKTRRAGAMVSALEAVDQRKQQRIAATAAQYLALHPTKLQPRFDVVCIYLAPQGETTQIHWLENAF